MDGTSVKKRVVIATISTVLLTSPVELGLSDATTARIPGTFLPGSSIALAAQQTPPTPSPVTPEQEAIVQRNDPGAQLSQARKYMERELTEQQLEEDRKTHGTAAGRRPEKAESAGGIQAESAGGNRRQSYLYPDKNSDRPFRSVDGSGTAEDYRALYRQDRVAGGSVCHYEGKTGLVTLQGLKHTKEKYVTARVPLKPGTVANTAALNKQLHRFNGTNDVQLRILVHAGKEPGTTDYEIAAYEPKQNQSVTLYLDNNGYETSGRFRQGIFYNIRSLTGMRDSLRLNYMRSEGTNIYGIGYSLPVGKMGTRLDFDYSGNTTKIIKGDAKPLDIKGEASSIGLAIRHPLRVDQKRRDEVGLQYLNQKSKTKWRLIDYWTEDKRSTFIPYISFTHYGDSSILYHKHSFPITSFKNTASGDWENNSNYVSYQLNMLYQKKYKHGQMFSARLDGQLANDKDRSSADRFYLGGANSVRGYEESFIGGNKGVTVGLTYQVPLDKKQRYHVFTFFDYGWVSDDLDLNASSYSAYSTGLGLSASYKNLYASLTLGIPLKKEYEFTTKKVSSTRFDFVMSATF